MKFDTPDGSDGTATAEGGDEMGCKAIDFLFVIDNSGSMGDNQQNLITSFPGFIQGIQDTVDKANGDYHVMVVRTDSQWGGDCKMLCAGFGFCPDIPEYPCNGGPPSMCDSVMGAGVNYPLGEDSSNKLCPIAGGRRYITAEEPNLATTFSCIAKLGTDGDSDERPAEAMTAALSDMLNGQGGCNQDFLRDEAILVITVITDEEDSTSPGSPDGWYANLIAAKAGDPNAIVMLGLINDVGEMNMQCPMESEDPVRLRTLIDMFPNGSTGSVCAPDYGQFFKDAVALVDTTCDDYVPPG
jgi:hypothetical protein